MNVVMNVTGYREALHSALQVDVGTGLVVPVISVPALAADILGDATKRDRLIIHMLPDRLTSSEMTAALLDQFEQGFASAAL